MAKTGPAVSASQRPEWPAPLKALLSAAGPPEPTLRSAPSSVQETAHVTLHTPVAPLSSPHLLTKWLWFQAGSVPVRAPQSLLGPGHTIKTVLAKEGFTETKTRVGYNLQNSP